MSKETNPQFFKLYANFGQYEAINMLLSCIKEDPKSINNIDLPKITNYLQIYENLKQKKIKIKGLLNLFEKSLEGLDTIRLIDLLYLRKHTNTFPRDLPLCELTAYVNKHFIKPLEKTNEEIDKEFSDGIENCFIRPLDKLKEKFTEEIKAIRKKKEQQLNKENRQLLYKSYNSFLDKNNITFLFPTFLSILSSSSLTTNLNRKQERKYQPATEDEVNVAVTLSTSYQTAKKKLRIVGSVLEKLKEIKALEGSNKNKLKQIIKLYNGLNEEDSQKNSDIKILSEHRQLTGTLTDIFKKGIAILSNILGIGMPIAIIKHKFLWLNKKPESAETILKHQAILDIPQETAIEAIKHYRIK